MNCRVDSDAYAYAMFGVCFLAWVGYNVVNNAYKNKAELTEVALNYALNETENLRNRLRHIQGICVEPFHNVIEGTVSGYETDDEESEDVGCENETEENN